MSRKGRLTAGYEHLNIDERESILKMRAEQKSMRQIGEYLSRDAGTISRELRRNIRSAGEYKPHLAQRYYVQRRKESKHPYRLEEDKWLCRHTKGRLKKYWSPEQISDTLQKDCAKVISPVTIYSWVYRNCAEGGEFYKYLRLSHRWRRRRRDGVDQRGQMPERRMIDKRPRVVQERKRIGDWESDTLEGRKSCGLLATHVERKSRYTIAVKVKDKSADTVSGATVRAMKKLPKEKVKTMTFDNGKEFAGFKRLEQGLGMRSYFANPYHSWERGTNENTNPDKSGLRQFFPKGTNFALVRQADVDRVIRLMNNRPRKCLNYRTPAEVFWGKPMCCASG